MALRRPASPGTLDFSRAQRFEGGLQVTVSTQRPFSPSDTAAGHSPGNRAVTVEVTVLNGSEERLDLALVSVEARDADGRTAEKIFDSAEGITGGLSGTLLPGRQSVATYAFDLPGNAASSLDVEVRPGFDYVGGMEQYHILIRRGRSGRGTEQGPPAPNRLLLAFTHQFGVVDLFEV